MTEAFDFEGDRNRTYNLWIKSPLLYQLSYAPGTTLSRLDNVRPDPQPTRADELFALYPNYLVLSLRFF
jgi:hypothetical protein